MPAVPAVSGEVLVMTSGAAAIVNEVVSCTKRLELTIRVYAPGGRFWVARVNTYCPAVGLKVNAAAVPSGASAAKRVPEALAKPMETAFGEVTASVMGLVTWKSVKATGMVAPCVKLGEPVPSGGWNVSVSGGLGSAAVKATTKSLYCLVCP